VVTEKGEIAAVGEIWVLRPLDDSHERLAQLEQLEEPIGAGVSGHKELVSVFVDFAFVVGSVAFAFFGVAASGGVVFVVLLPFAFAGGIGFGDADVVWNDPGAAS
jgi:hypothetical protein